ncbi:MAG: uroporphyrinogen-III synthase, partial [Planctomycetota bacterium]
VHQDLSTPELAARLAVLRAGDALVVTSAHAARRLAGLRAAPGVLVAAVGAATGAELRAGGWSVALTGHAGAAALGRALELARGARVLFPCAEDARGELEAELVPRGFEVERLALYRTHPAPAPRFASEATQRLYTSPSAVAAALPFERRQLPRAARLALGPSTAAALAAAGLAHATCASTDPEDVLAALLAAHTEEESPR